MTAALNSNSSNGKITIDRPGDRSVNGSTSGEHFQGPPADQAIALESCVDAIGAAIAATTAGHSLRLETADGLRLRAGFSIIIAAENPNRISTALAHILSHLKRDQVAHHQALAALDPEMHRQKVERVRAEYASFLDGDTMPDPVHVAHYTGQIAALQAALRPMRLIENPAPGRLTLAIAKSPDYRLLATMDDLSLSSFLDAARTPRGRLDFELLGKSFRQEAFDGAFLEGVHPSPISAPLVSALVIARPQTVARLLLSDDLEVMRFAEGCLVINLPELASRPSDLAWQRIAYWKQSVSRLINLEPQKPAIIRMDEQAIAIMANLASYQQALADGNRNGPGHKSHHLTQLPALASKIALGLWAGCEAVDDALGPELAAMAIDFAKMNLNSRQSLVEENGQALGDLDFQADCQKVLSKITAASGSVGTRDLCRKIHGAKAGWLRPILQDLIKAGKIAELPDGRVQSREQALMTSALASA